MTGAWSWFSAPLAPTSPSRKRLSCPGRPRKRSGTSSRPGWCGHPVRTAADGGSVRTWSSTVYFFLVKELPIRLDKKLRRELFELLAASKERAGRWRREARKLVLEGEVPVVLATDEILKRVEDRIGTFLRGRSRVVSRPEILGGEPVFEGTRISVRNVGERARKGESVAELLDDYPALNAQDVEFARMFAALGRPPGRPRKKLRFVR
jgi:uncharacterized protein (DUF433 family)